MGIGIQISQARLGDQRTLILDEIVRVEGFRNYLKQEFAKCGCVDPMHISWEAFQSFLSIREVQLLLRVHMLSVSDANYIFHALDAENRNGISVDGFVEGFLLLKSMRGSRSQVQRLERLERKAQEIHDRVNSPLAQFHSDLQTLKSQLHAIRLELAELR